MTFLVSFALTSAAASPCPTAPPTWSCWADAYDANPDAALEALDTLKIPKRFAVQEDLAERLWVVAEALRAHQQTRVDGSWFALAEGAALAGHPKYKETRLDEIYAVRGEAAYTAWVTAGRAWQAEPTAANKARLEAARKPKYALWTWAHREIERGRDAKEVHLRCVAFVGTDGLCSPE